MFVLLKTNKVIEDVTDIINTYENTIICTSTTKVSYSKDDILCISTLYPSKDMLSCLVDEVSAQSRDLISK